MLEVRGLTVSYGPIRSVKGIDLEVRPGEIVTLIGANGAGKTTILRALAGLQPFGGEVIFDGQRVSPGQVERLVRRGLVLVPEGRGILAQMTVRENLLMGAYGRKDRRAAVRESEAILDRFPVLRERLDAGAGMLSGGEQQMLAIGRALMAKPRLLMLDEPSLGLAPIIVDRVFDLVEELRRSGITILLVEQKARQALAVADRGYLLELGRVVAAGNALELGHGSLIENSFLGRSNSAAV
jgi:branched-chain amino acid transport system ATP-binding protein